MIKLFVPEITPRVHYAAAELGRLVGLDVEPINEPTGRWHLIMGNAGTSEAISIGKGAILFETDVQPCTIEWGMWDDLPIIFATAEALDVPFDLLGAVFFFLSRHEEYTCFERDQHGRFPSHKSALVQRGIEEIPLLELWAAKLREMLKKRFPELKFAEPRFELLPTFDIDSAFAYAHKGFLRTLGGFARDFSKGDFRNARFRMSVLQGKMADPYAVYDWLEQTLDRAGLQRKYFFLLADFGAHNKNVSHRSNALCALIRKLDSQNETGIHPGYLTAENDGIMQEEISRLAQITGGEVHISRQHYLRMELPETYESLIRCGIREDYTMGHADRPGFRAGTSRPFGFFNLKTNEARPLTVVPFVCMDATLRYYMNLGPDEAAARLAKMRKALEKSNSRMLLLWHNESLGEHGPWAGWRKVFETAIR